MSTPVINWTIWIYAPEGASGPTEPPLRLEQFKAYDHAASAISDAGGAIRRHRNKFDRYCRVELKRDDGTVLHEPANRPTLDEFFK